MKKMITEFDKLLNQKKGPSKDEYKIRKRSTLMSASRCAIFESLCHHPCSSVSCIAKALKLSESSVRWHLDKLVYERFVTVKENGNTFFFPSNMIKPEHIHIFKVLALERSQAVLSLIRTQEGLSQSELRKELDLNLRTVVKYASDLAALGLIRSASDGKYRRYYPTSLMDDLKDYYRKHARHFKEYLLKKTTQDGLRPKIILSTPELLKLKFVMGVESRIVTVPMIPFEGDGFGLRKMGKERNMPKSSPTLSSSRMRDSPQASCVEAFRKITS